MERLRVRIADIDTDADTQSRVEWSDETVKEYEALVRAGVELPPVELVTDGENYWPWDGRHRLAAYLAAETEEVCANVQTGTLALARWLACSANKAHGLKRTNDDKRRAVEMALTIRPNLSNYAIAEHCGVSDEMVRLCRKSLPTVGSGKSLPTVGSGTGKRTGRDGRTTNTANIGKKKPKGNGEEVSREEGEAVLNGHAGAAVSPPATEGENEAVRAAAPVLDELGQAVPEALRAGYAAREPMLEIAKELRAVARRVSDLCKDEPGAYALRKACRLKTTDTGEKESQTFRLEPLWSALKLIESAAPFTLCPHCWDVHPGRAGPRCEACVGSGVVDRFYFNRTDEALRHAVEHRDRIDTLATEGATTS